MRLRKRYDCLKETVNSNICGDGYNAEGRTERIVNKCNALIDEAYDKGYTDAIDEFAEEIKSLIYKWFEKGVINTSQIDKIAEQLKENK